MTSLVRLDVRHDRSGGTSEAHLRAMVRPGQLELRADAGTPDADGALVTVAELRPRGAETEVVLRLDAPDQAPVVLRRPAHALAGVDVGTRVRLAVAGGVVLYAG